MASSTPVKPQTEESAKQRLTSKKKKDKTLKNVIALPYERYWPFLDTKDEDDAKELINVLRSVLVKLRSEELDLPGYGSFGKTKEDKAKYKSVVRDKRLTSEHFQEQKQLRSELLVGVNCVARGLESCKVAVCVVAGDCDPASLVSHLLHSAGASRIPALVLPSLKQLSQDVAGFSCLALGIKKGPTNSELEVLVAEVTRISSQYPLTASLKILSTHQTDKTPESDTTPVQKPSKPVTVDISKLHLKRLSNGARAFIPGSQPVSKSEDFLAFGNMETCLGEVKPFMPLRFKTKLSYKQESEDGKGDFNKNISHKDKSEQGKYQQLQVKRLQPNPNKKTKKGKTKTKVRS